MTQSSLIKLHLGAFDCAINGWVNTDITPHIAVSKIPGAVRVLHALGKLNETRYAQHRDGRFRSLKYMDLTKPLPYPSGSVAAVFSSHVFEHLFPDEVERLIREIHRVLAPDGVCRVSVPDLDKALSAYTRENPEEFLEILFAVKQRKDINHGHHWGYTGPSLKRLFEAAGFARVEEMDYRTGRCPDIDRLDNRPDESLFVEAVK
jgi:predicted SAM-dependent methyltransferase